MGEKTVVELRHVTKRFGETFAAQDVTLEILKGEFFALLGPSGAGKTTIIRLIGGVETPDEGEILINGQPVNALEAYQRNVNTVFQNLLLFPHLTVYDNIAYGLKVKKKPRLEINREVLAMLEFMSLSRLAERKPRTLSGGEQQRVAIARALINRPLVLICDEPLTALDPFLRYQMQSELKRIKEIFGITLIYITHNHEEALEMADRVAILQQGKIVQVGSPAEIYNSPSNRFVAEFVGRINVFEGQVVQAANTVLTEEGCKLKVKSEIGNFDSGMAWGIRPEKILLKPSDDDDRTCAPTNEFRGKITGRSFMGPIIEYQIRLECGKKLTAELINSDSHLDNGREVKVSFCADDLIPLKG